MLAWLPECGCTLACSAPKSLLGPIAGQVFDHVDVLAAAVVAPAGIAFGILVGEHAAHGLHDGGAGVVFAGDHLQAVGLAHHFAGDGRPDFRVVLFDRVHGGFSELGESMDDILSVVVRRSSMTIVLSSFGDEIHGQATAAEAYVSYSHRIR